MSQPLLTRAHGAVRAGDWWAYKIPPLLITAYAGALRFELAPVAWTMVGIAIAAILAVAVYGYVLNDVCDIEADSRSGRPNRMATVSWPVRAGLLAISAAVALALAASGGDRVMLALVAANLLLPTLYSVPPVRLKGRGVFGALADAGGVHALPMALVARAVTVDAVASPELVAAFVWSAIGWAALAGFRGIIVHQVADLQADTLADVTTFAGRLGVTRARRLALRLVFPLELVALALFLVIVLPSAPFTIVALAVYTVLDGLKIRRRWKLPLFDPPASSNERYIPIVNNEIYEVWLPLALVVDLLRVSPWAFPVAAAHLWLFWPNIAVRLGSAWRLLVPAPHEEMPREEAPPYRVVIGATTWTVNGVNVFSANLARGLTTNGVHAHVLLSEQETDLVDTHEKLMPFPADVAFDVLPVERSEGWGMHWGATVRYLREMAPCVYIPNSDWRHSCVCPQLPDEVIVVGVVHSDDPLHYDHVRRLGRYWNAAVAVSDAVQRKTIEICPEIADRITTVPIGVRIPAQRPPHPSERDRLRVVYHGILKQHQKRVLDFPHIVRAALDAGVPIEMTIVGSGPDEAALREAAAPLVAEGAIRFTGVVSPDDTPAILEAHDVYLLTSEFEGMPNALIEAMGRGLVPLVTRMTSGVPELIDDGRNGFMVPIGDYAAFAARLQQLWTSPQLRETLSKEAFETVSRGPFRVEAMVAGYREVFDRAVRDARAGRFVRPRDVLSLPPAEVAGVKLFPVALEHHEAELGAFPERGDAEDYRDQTTAALSGARHATEIARGYSPVVVTGDALAGMRVFVATPIWTPHGINAWSEDVVRALRRARVDACLLLTEEATDLITIPGTRMRLPLDLPVEQLNVLPNDGWAVRWGATIRLLESHAPCVYIPSHDWRHAAVTPALSNEVLVVGVVHDRSDISTEQVSRLGTSWNAIVGNSRDVSRHLRRALPELHDRVVTIPHGVDVLAPSATMVAARPAWRLIAFGHKLDEPLQAFLHAVTTSEPTARVTVIDPPDAMAGGCAALGWQVVVAPNRQEWLALCDASAIVVSRASSGETRRLIVEAMGRSCIPCVTRQGAGDLPLIDGETGIIVETDWRDAAARIAALAADPEALTGLAARARAMAWDVTYRNDEMSQAFLDLLARTRAAAASGTFQRVRGPLRPPPAAVGTASLFPVDLPYATNRGPFASEYDARRFAETSGLDVVATAGPDGA